MSPALLERLEQSLRAPYRRTPAAETGALLVEATAPLVCAPAAKRVRPRLLFAFAELAGVESAERVVECARAVELIHAASLLHDDVIDGADERRGLPSANARFGNSAAVLAGDHVLASAIQALAFDPRAMKAAIDVVLCMSASAVTEVEVRGHIDVDESVLSGIITGKTAGLFGLCGRLAGLLVDDEDVAARFERAALDLGLAFQVADDRADLAGDLVERSPTLPMLWSDRTRAVTALWAGPVVDEAEAAALADEIAQGPARSRTADFVSAHVESARAALAPFAGLAAHDEIFRFAATLAGR